MTNDGQFKIYSSKAKHPTGGDDTKVLQAGTGIDNFVSMLIDEVLILQSAPTKSNLSVEFDYSSDQLATWMRLFDPKATFTLGFDNATDKNIASFDFHLTTPTKWDLTFSSSSTALHFAFGDDGDKVPVPGLMPDGKLLYFGLDQSRSKVATATVKDLFSFVGVPASPPSAIANWPASLKPESAASKHNAMWLAPLNYYQTIVRLQFTLDGPSVTALQAVISQALKSLTLNEVDIICKKVLTRAKSGGKYIAVSEGEVMMEASCSLKPKDKELTIKAGIVFYIGGYDLILRFDEGDVLGVILEWLAQLAGQDFKFIEALVDDKTNSPFGKNIFLRRVKIGLDASADGLKVDFRSFALDIEVKATFGQKPVFLLSYHWEKKRGTSQSITGKFWNDFDSTSLRKLGPAYEYINDLTPNLPAPDVISIMSLLPGGNADSLPRNIPSDIRQAYIVLSTDSIAIGGTVQAKDPGSAHYPVPQLNMGWISVNGSYSWTTKQAHLGIDVMVELTAPGYSKHQDTAVLVGSIDYSTGSWTMRASLTGLYLSTLYDFFDKSSGEGDHVIPLIDSIEIEELTLVYNYAKAEGGGGGTKKVDGSEFFLTGTILIDVLKLELNFHYNTNGWTFHASLSSKSESPSTVGNVLKHMLANPNLELPGFIDGIVLKPGTDKIQLFMEKPKSGSTDPFQFITVVNVGIDGFQFTLTFAQFHGADWDPDTPSKRLVKVAITAVPEVNVPLVGNLTQPFDEMYYMWVQDGTKRNNPRLPGLTRVEVNQLNDNKLIHDDPLTFKEKYRTLADDDVLFTAGSHLAIFIKDGQNKPTCILDYDFKKQPQPSGPQKPAQEAMLREGTRPGKEPDSDGTSSTAPFKKKAGPLSISNIGLKYADQMLHIRFDATMELGPISLALLGFSIDVRLTSLNLKHVGLSGVSASLEGFTVAFEKPPLTIAGIIRHGNDPGLDYYTGGLIVGWVPYQLEAAGFYGDCKPKGGSSFKSVFVFARLDGPLFSLEFAEISGVTGGFGYNSDAKFPTPDQITNYPFINQNQLGDAKDARATLEKLTDPNGAGWFRHLNGTYWAAAGMKIDAFQMIALDAVVVVEFGNAIKLGIFGVALADIPDSLSSWKFAHVELGIAIVVDFDYGVLKAEAQLSNRSYILDPNCHLTGGFALYYWFDAPYADRDNIGNFVFTLGGYHQAFDVPTGWPKPDRLRIAWSLGSDISIAGEAYFAITPKVCMGGGRLRASYQAGPIKAWFDAFANFLINYKPFHFLAEAGIDVGVQFSARILFVHISIGVEISADLYLWGPPVAGQVDVDLKVHKFTIHFGAGKHDPDPVDLEAFYNLVLQASSKNPQAQPSARQSRIRGLTDIEAEEEMTNFSQMPKDQGHTFLAQSGLMNDSTNPSRTQDEQWVVRGGTFSFVVGCKMVIDSGTIYSNDNEPIASVTSGTEAIYAKPMHLSGNDCLDSSLKVTIKQPESYRWGISQQYKSVPTGLWGEYQSGADPNQGNGNNNIKSLLDADKSSVRLMTGILVTAPPPILSQDRMKKFKILEATLTPIQAVRGFPDKVPCYNDWAPEKPAEGGKQWDDVHDKWKTPTWDHDHKASRETKFEEEEENTVSQGSGAEDYRTRFVRLWAGAFKWDEKFLSSIAGLPNNMDRRFRQVFVAAPLMTK
jgi:hypothetical protein